MELQSEEIPKKLSESEIKGIPKIYNTQLTKRGFSIIKSELNDKDLNKVKKDLKVKPFINLDYGPDAKAFSVYLESKTKLYLPKFYGYQKYGKPLDTKLDKGKAIDIKFNGDLRDNQKPVVEKFLKSCDKDNGDNGDNGNNGNNEIEIKSNGGIISVGCGFGKTVLALYLTAMLSRKTLVIVHKEFLMNQWKDRILEYLPDAKVGFIQGTKIQVEDNDIVIGMLQSISMKDYERDVFSEFGFCIIDECHHIGAEVFSRSLPKINSYYMLGLSATPKRKDGLSKVFEWYIGPYIFQAKKRETRTADARMVYYDNSTEPYRRIEYMINGKLSIPKMITNISVSTRRNQFITSLLKNITRDITRKVLVLGDRRDQLCCIFKMLATENFTNVGYYIGGMKEKDLKISSTKQILLATYSMSSEGMDIPSLNTLMLISSKSDIEQSIGRILRKNHGETVPIIYDIVDNFSVFGNQAIKRQKFYTRNGFNVYTSRVEDQGVDTLENLVEKAGKGVLKERKPRGKRGVKEGVEKGVCLL